MTTHSLQKEQTCQSSPTSKMPEEDKAFSSLTKKAGAATTAGATTKPTLANASTTSISGIAMSNSEELDESGSGAGGGRAKVEGPILSTPEKRKAATTTVAAAAAVLLVPASLWYQNGEDSGYEAKMEADMNGSSATRGRRYRHYHRRSRGGVVLPSRSKKRSVFMLPPAALDYEEAQAQIINIREAETATTGSAVGIESGYEGDIDTATDIGTNTASDAAADVESVGSATGTGSGYEGDVDTATGTSTDNATDIDSGHEGDVNTGTDTEGMDSGCERQNHSNMAGTESGYEGDLDTGVDTTTDSEANYDEDTDTGKETESGAESGYEGDVDSDYPF